MAKQRLILVEGMAGAGKSTTSQWLTLALAERHAARWSHEYGQGGLRTFYSSQQWSSVRNYSEALLTRWQEFAAELNDTADERESVHVIESALLQIPVLGLLLADVNRARIRAVIDAIQAVIRPIAPCLVYLRAENVPETLRTATASRYEELLGEYIRRNEHSEYGRRRNLVGFQGLVEFWNEVRALSDDVFCDFGAPKLLVHVKDNEWAHRYAQISHFLRGIGLDVSDELGVAGDVGDLSRYTGTYIRCVDGAEQPFEIGVSEGQLTVFGLAPYLWNAGNRLIPRRRNFFIAASWPTEVHFVESSGSVTGFRLITVPGGRATDELFRRIGP